MIGMTLPLARSYSSFGIRVNSIAPGMFYTPMLQGYEEMVLALEQTIPFPKRLGTAEDYFKAVEVYTTGHFVLTNYLVFDELLDGKWCCSPN